jgi:hypothetical protein
MNPTGFIMAVRLTEREVMSARPDAPVVPDRRSARQPMQQLRIATARTLRRTADRVEPKTKCAVTYG